MSDTLEVKVAELDQRAKSNTRRIDKLEQSTDALHELTIVVREMVLKQDYTVDSINKLTSQVGAIDGRIDEIEKKPAKKWEGVVEKIIYVVITAIVVYFLAKLGL